MTHGKQFAKTIFDVQLNGENSSTHVTSRSVATDDSEQFFESKFMEMQNHLLIVSVMQ